MVYDIGGMKVVDQQLTDFLMVDFLRLRTMLGEDLFTMSGPTTPRYKTQ